MIHPKTPSPSYNRQRKKRLTNSGRNLVESAQSIRLDERATSQAPKDFQESDALGFFESLEQEKAQAEMAKMLEKKKIYPIAPDAFIPNSTLRSMFKIKETEPVEVKMFRLRLILPTIQMDIDERLKRYSVLTNFYGIHSTIFQSLNRIDILDNLQSKTNKNLNWQNDDDEWVELGDPEASFDEKISDTNKSKNARQTTDTLVSRQKETIPEIFKRMRNEPWWLQSDDESNNNLRSMLLYLIDILRDKDKNSYESACNYVVEIFRTYGIEPSLVDQILSILLDHLVLSDNDPLDIQTVRTIAQFMIERKNIIIQLLNYASKYPADNILRQETINAIKFITDVNSSDDIDLVLDNMSSVRDTADETFSLKSIIERLRAKQKRSPLNLNHDGEENEGDILHPLIKKISEERWYPRDNNPLTLDSIINAILMKLPNASKTLLKTLTTHLVQLHRIIGYSNEQYNRVANGLIELLGHNDADYRLIAATILANLGKETKTIDIALLNSFLNDPRILVRTECCDTLKKLSGIMSDTVLKDCAENIQYLQTLPEENFTLQNYLKEKNRMPTPPPRAPITKTDGQSSVSVKVDREEEETKAVEVQEETETVDDQEEKTETVDEQEEETKIFNEREETILPTNTDQQEEFDINIEDSTQLLPVNNQVDHVTSFVRSRSPPPHHEEQSTTQINHQVAPSRPGQFSITPSLNSSTTLLTPIEPSIRVEINEKTKTFIPRTQHVSQSRKEITPAPPPPPPPSSQPPRQRKQQTDVYNRTPIKIIVSDQSNEIRSLLLPNTSNMWDSYAKQTEVIKETNSEILPSTEVTQEQVPDPVQTIIDDHKHNIGYYRMRPNRRVLIPHKISFDDVFADLSHMTVDKKPPLRSVSHVTNTMHLSDLNRNKRHLHEVEFVQLLSSLVIRSIQIHKKHERFIPGPFSFLSDSTTSFTDALTISQMQIHSPTSLDQANLYVSNKLPPIIRQRPSSAEIARMKTDAHTKARRVGVNLRKARDMEDALSQLLTTDREQSRSTFVPTNTPHITTLGSISNQNDVTHAWILEQILKSQGTTDPQNYIQQICRAYPKFTPLLHSRVPQNLIPIIWNDPVLKQLASIISNKQDDSSMEDSSTKRSSTKPSIPTFDDEHSSNLFDYSMSNHLLTMQQQQRDEHKKKYLPPVRGVKMRLPRHIIKFGYRELDADSPETSLDSLRDENTSKSRRRRIYMHLMMSVNENMLVRHELVKSQLRHMLKTDYRSRTFLPIIAKPPVCN